MRLTGFDAWMQEQKPFAKAKELPEGIWEKDGKHFASCRVCECTYEIGCDPQDFSEEGNYCGRNQWCLP